METFQVVSASANSAHPGDTFIIEDGHRTVAQVSNKKVYMDDGSSYPKKLFAKWMRIERYLRKQRQANVDNRLKAAKLREDTKVGNFKPSLALRYVIMENNETKEYRWYFAKNQTSHSSMGQELRKEYPERSYSVLAGGFYTCIRANANFSLKNYWGNEDDSVGLKNTIILFGKSDTYGLRIHHLERALPLLREKYNVIVMNNYESIIPMTV